MPDPNLTISALAGPGISIATMLTVIGYLLKWGASLRSDMNLIAKEAANNTERKIKQHSEHKDEERRPIDSDIKSRIQRQWERIERLTNEKMDADKHTQVCTINQLQTAAQIRNSIEPIAEQLRTQSVCIGNIERSLRQIHHRQVEITKKWVKTVIPADDD